MASLNICFLARPCYDVFSAKIYAELKKNFDSGVIGHFITSNSEESDYIKNTLGSDNVYIHEVSSYFKAHWDEFTKDDLVANEKSMTVHLSGNISIWTGSLSIVTMNMP